MSPRVTEAPRTGAPGLTIMFSQLGDKLQDIFKDLRGHGSITEANVERRDAPGTARFA